MMNLRVEQIFREEFKGDRSFMEKPSLISMLFGGLNPKHQKELRETWIAGIKVGIETGLMKASVEGQVVDLTNNCKDERHIEFRDKFFKLAEEYNCQIQYHPKHGMMVMDISKHHINIK